MRKRLWTNSQVQECVRQNREINYSHASDACVGAVVDVMWGFLTVEDAMDKYFDGTFWPQVTLSKSAEDLVRRMLIEVEVLRERGSR